jgi:NADPH:quinone reductase-like Zn-dependent oxidoreductase
VIDYTKEDIASTLSLRHLELKRDYDLLVDCVGGTDLLSVYASPSPFLRYHRSLILPQPQLLNLKGAYVTIVGDKTDVRSLGGPITYLTSPTQIFRFIKGWLFGPRYACLSLYSKSSLLEQTARLADRGEVRAEVQEVIEGAFDEREAWRKAVQMMEEKRVRGKIILAIP